MFQNVVPVPAYILRVLLHIKKNATRELLKAKKIKIKKINTTKS